MKLLLLLFIPFVSFAQKNNALTFPAANITSTQIIAAFVTSGYPMGKTTDGYYSTGATQKKYTSIKMALFLKDSVYILQGWMNLDITLMGQRSEFKQVEQRGSKNSPLLNAWGEMVAVAGKLSKDVKFVRL